MMIRSPVTLAVLLAAAAAPVLPTAVPAGAAPCPDVQVVFARGTNEPPGVGGIGQAFVDALRTRLAPRSVDAYAVDYPATSDFGPSTTAGAIDTRAHVQELVTDCPRTRVVLGGYSQGAGVIDVATNAMAPDVAGHVAADALFGAPRSRFADSLAPGPLPVTGPLYVAKTIDQCVPNDPICAEPGFDMRAHSAYIQTGKVDEAADFAAARV